MTSSAYRRDDLADGGQRDGAILFAVWVLALANIGSGSAAVCAAADCAHELQASAAPVMNRYDQ